MSVTISIDPKATVRRRCAWCREPQDGRGNIALGEPVTDCICHECRQRYFRNEGEPVNVERPTLDVERSTNQQEAA